MVVPDMTMEIRSLDRAQRRHGAFGVVKEADRKAQSLAWRASFD